METQPQNQTSTDQNSTAGNSSTDSNFSNKSKKRKTNLYEKRHKKLIWGAIILILLLIGGGAAYYLTKISQDVRQQAWQDPYATPAPRYTPTPVPGECPTDVTPYVSSTGSIPAGYAHCNAGWCLQLNLPPQFAHCQYLAEGYTDLPQNCGNQETHLRKRSLIGNGGQICFDHFSWGDDCKAQIDIRANQSGAPAGNSKTYLINCGGGDDDPTPTPERTPTPTRTPPPECVDLQADPQTLGDQGGTVQLTTTAVGDSLNYTYDGTDGTFNPATGNTPTSSWSLTNIDPGSYSAWVTVSNMAGSSGGRGSSCEVEVEVNEAAPQCNDIRMLDTQMNPIPDQDDLSVNQVVVFECSANNPHQVDHYEFQVGRFAPNGHVDASRLEANPQVKNLSVEYTIPEHGKFMAQCRICTGPNTCQSWEPPPPPPLPQP
jgi:hypothetical protein